MLKRLEMNNFVCFQGQQIIDFEDREGVILVIGSYDEDPEMSNQAGKTMVMNAVLYALYGWNRTICAREVDLIYEHADKMADKMEVLLTLEVGGQEIHIRRGRTNDNKPIFAVAGFGGQKDEQQAKLSELLGMSFNDFLATAFFQQGDIHVFMGAKPAEKKAFLKRWMNFDRWDSYADKAKGEIAVAQGNENTIKMAIEQLDALMLESVDESEMAQMQEERAKRVQQSENGKQVEMQLQKEMDDLPDPTALEQQVVKTKDAVLEVERQRLVVLGRIDEASKAITMAHQVAQELLSLEGADKSVTKAQQDLQALDTELSGLRKSIEETHVQAEAFRPQLNQLEQQRLVLAQNEGTLESKRNEQAELSEKIRSFGSHCPFDKKPCDRVGPNFVTELQQAEANFQQELGTLRQQVVELTNQRAAIEKQQHSIRDQAKIITNTLGQRGDWRRQLEEHLQASNQRVQRKQFLAGQPQIGQTEATLEQLNNDLALWEKQMHEAKGDLLKAANEYTAFAGRREERQVLQVKIDNARTLQKGANTRVSEIDKILGGIEERKRQRVEAASTKIIKEKELQEARVLLNRWNFLNQMFRFEIPSLLTENAFEEVEEETNFVLKGLHSDMRIQFQATRELQRNEEVCSVCGEPYPARARACQRCGFGLRKKKRKDELVLDVHQGESTRSFQMVSGGGKALISIALRIALSKLLQRRNGSQIDWLQMDEVFGTLDKPNRENTIRMIFDVLMAVMGFRQILVISHTDVAMSGYNILKVQRHEHHSTVGWE